MLSIVAKILPFLFRKAWVFAIGAIAQAVETVVRALKNTHMTILDWMYEYRTHPVHTL